MFKIWFFVIVQENNTKIICYETLCFINLVITITKNATLFNSAFIIHTQEQQKNNGRRILIMKTKNTPTTILHT